VKATACVQREAGGREVRLEDLTSFRTGGRPRHYARPRTCEGLRAALRLCSKRGLPVHTMGGGTNLLVDDGELPFAVVHVCAPGLCWIRRTGPCSVRVGAGVRMSRLLSYCARAGLGGMEFMAGIPGTVGGALAGNAGAWGGSIGDPLARLWLVDLRGRLDERPAEGVRFSYRNCSLGEGIIAEAEFMLQPCAPRQVAERMKEYATWKARSHPLSRPSAGCIFKNPPGSEPAGRLLDLCGLKGTRVGGAQVSALHANFICNMAQASSVDVMSLIQVMQSAVRTRFGVELEMEIKHWPSQPVAA